MTQALADEFKRVQDRILVEGAPTEMLAKMYAELGAADDDDAIETLIRSEYERRSKLKALRSAPPQVDAPEIIVKSDFDNYFERLVRRLVEEKQAAGEKFFHKTLTITAGPYRSSVITMKSDGESNLTLDFYSAARNGFGSLSQDDLNDIKGRWL